MLVSTKGRYALRVMAELACHPTNEYVPLKTIAAEQEISEKYLENIIAVLSKAGVIDALRGKGGGYRLNRDAKDYSVGEILRLTEGTIAPVSCLECSTSSCERASSCRTLPMWQKLDGIISEYLDGVTIADLAASADGDCKI